MENNVDFELESELLEDKRNDSQISVAMACQNIKQ